MSQPITRISFFCALFSGIVLSVFTVYERNKASSGQFEMSLKGTWVVAEEWSYATTRAEFPKNGEVTRFDVGETVVNRDNAEVIISDSTMKELASGDTLEFEVRQGEKFNEIRFLSGQKVVQSGVFLCDDDHLLLLTHSDTEPPTTFNLSSPSVVPPASLTYLLRKE